MLKNTLGRNYFYRSKAKEDCKAKKLIKTILLSCLTYKKAQEY